MHVLLQAGVVSIDEIEGSLVVGFADRQFDTSEYFMLQRSLSSDDHGVYLEHRDQSYGTFGMVLSCKLATDRVEFTVDDMSAKSLGTEVAFAIDFESDEELLSRLRTGLELVFAGTSCRLELQANA